MAEPEKKIEYPWHKDYFLTGNLAVGNLRENLKARFNINGRIHAETLLFTTGAITGFAAQMAAAKRCKLAGKPIIRWIPPTPPESNEFLFVQTNTGKKFYFGDWLNCYLSPQPGPQRMTLWGYAAGAAHQQGVPAEELNSMVNDMYSHTSKTVGHDNYGVPRVPAENQPQLDLYQALKIGWPFAQQILTLPLSKQIPKVPPEREEVLDEEYWPAVLTLTASQFMMLVKDILKPKIGLALVMEGAIAASKIEASSWESVTFGEPKTS